MELRRLGKTDLKITKVGVGTAPIGSTPEWSIYWGPQDEQEAIKAIRKAIDLGVNWIDTAPFYGWGRAEEIVGKAVKGRRDKVYLFTKCGTIQDSMGGWSENLTPNSIRQEVEASLRRLQTDHIDLLQFHDPDPKTPIEESWQELLKLVDEGKVRCGGLSNHPIPLIQRTMRKGTVASLQTQYNLLERTAERDTMPFCLANNIGVLSWGSLSEGFLADGFSLDNLDPRDFRRTRPYAQPRNYSKIQKIRTVLDRLAKRRVVSMVDIVIAWELAHPGLTGAIIGVRNEKEATEMIGGTELKLTHEEIREIESALAVWKENQV